MQCGRPQQTHRGIADMNTSSDYATTHQRISVNQPFGTPPAFRRSTAPVPPSTTPPRILPLIRNQQRPTPWCKKSFPYGRTKPLRTIRGRSYQPHPSHPWISARPSRTL